MSQPLGYVLTQDLPAIPAKRYFTIGEVSLLCGVRSYVLRYWEQEFEQLRPMKRRGNRRYYQHHEVLLVRTIRTLLYEQGYTIQGARQQLDTKNSDDVSSFELLSDNAIDVNDFNNAAQSSNAETSTDPHDTLSGSTNSSPSQTLSRIPLDIAADCRLDMIAKLRAARDLLKH